MELFEEQLSKLLAEGDDRSAFRLLYDRYWDRLFCYTVKVIGHKDDALDIVQEAFIALWEQRHRITTLQSPDAYLFAIIRYKSLRYIRKNIHRTEYLDSLSDFLTRQDQSPEELLITHELQQLIDTEIQKFPKKMRAVFMLSRQDDLSHKEIAEKLAISDKTVKKQISNSLKLLRLKINNYYLLLAISLLIGVCRKIF